MAIDITYVAYYGDSDEFQMSTGAPPNKSYLWCYKMATVSIVGEEIKLLFGMRLLRGYISRGVLIEQLIEIANNHVSLGTVYADAEFDSIGVIDTLEEEHLSYHGSGYPNTELDPIITDIHTKAPRTQQDRGSQP